MKPILVLLLGSFCLVAQEARIEARLHELRKLPEDERLKVTRELALEIRRLPATAKKEPLAEQLAGLATDAERKGTCEPWPEKWCW